jgi:ribonuclease HI
MHFDKEQSQSSNGVGIISISPQGYTLNFSYTLEFEATNNIVEYQALFLGLELVVKMGIRC